MTHEINRVYSSQLKPKQKKYIKRNYILHQKRWYSKLVKSNNQGLLDYYKLEDFLSHLVVCLTKKYIGDEDPTFLYNYFDSYIEFYHYQKKFNQNERSFFEVINFFQKPHFDIDIDFEKVLKYYDDNIVTIEELHKIGQLLISTIIKGCQVVMSPNDLNFEKDVLVYTSHDLNRVSYHIILDHWCHHDHIEAKAFFDQVHNYCEGELKGKYVELMDNSVYKTNQNFRMLGSQKCNTNRTKIFQPYFYINDNIINHVNLVFDHIDKQGLHDLSKSLVTFTSGCQLLQTFYIEKNITYTKNNYCITPQDLEEIKVMLHNKFNNMFSIREVNGFKIFLKRAKPYYCELCGRIHPHENPRIYVFNSAVRWTCWRREDKKTILLGYLSSATNKDDQEIAIEDEPDNENLLIFGDYSIDLNTTHVLNTNSVLTTPEQQDKNKIVDVKPDGIQMLQSNGLKYKNRQSIRQTKNNVSFSTLIK